MTDRELFNNTEEYIGKTITIEGWIKNHRKQKELGFISFSDGKVNRQRGRESVRIYGLYTGNVVH